MSRRRKGPTPPRTWEPLERAVARPNPSAEALSRALGQDPDELEMWMNDQYVVIVGGRWPDGSVAHLSIRRADRKPARDWRDLQQIKNQLAGDEAEAVELYPAQSRVVDMANQFHLWVLPAGERMPLGWEHGGRLNTDEIPDGLGAVQRPLEEPT